MLILFHLYCCSKRKLSTLYITYSECCEPFSFCDINILFQNVIQAFWIFYLYLLFMIGLINTIMGDSKHEFSSINLMYFLKKCHIAPLPPHKGDLSTMATLFCPLGGHCGEVQLYFEK